MRLYRHFFHRPLALLTLLVTFCAFAWPQPALAVTRASDRIQVYSQHASKYHDSAKWGVYDNHSNLYKAGCRLFAYAHAIEWLTGQKLGDTLLRQLLGACCSPSNNHGHEYEGCKNSPYKHDSSKTAYNALAENAYGLHASNQSVSLSASNLRSLFNKGRVIIGSIGEHMVLAVDYVICDKDLNVVSVKNSKSIPSGCKLYVQVIDSSADTSTAQGAAFDAAYYTMKNDRLTAGSKALRGGSSSGQEYWVESSVFKKGFSASTVLWGGSWKGHQE